MPIHIFTLVAVILSLSQPGAIEEFATTSITPVDSVIKEIGATDPSAGDDFVDVDLPSTVTAPSIQVTDDTTVSPTIPINLDGAVDPTHTERNRTEAYGEYLATVSFADLTELRQYPTQSESPRLKVVDAVDTVYAAELYGDVAVEEVDMTNLPFPEDQVSYVYQDSTNIYAVRSTIPDAPSSVAVTTPLEGEEYGIYALETDGSWTALLHESAVVYFGSCPADVDVLYAGLVDAVGGGSGEATIIFQRSDDSGSTWTEIPRSSIEMTQPHNEFFVDELNCDTVAAYSREGEYWKVSENSGSHFSCAEDIGSCALGEQ